MDRRAPSLVGVAMAGGVVLLLTVRRLSRHLRARATRVSPAEAKAALLADVTRGRERHPVTVDRDDHPALSESGGTAGAVWKGVQKAFQTGLHMAGGTKTGFQVETLSLVTEEGTSQGRVPLLLYSTRTHPPDAPSASRPAVIVIHPTGSCKEEISNHLEDLAEKGFVAVGMDCRYHGRRGSREDYDDALVRAWRGSGEHPFLLDNVWDVMHVLDYLATRQDVDQGRIGLTGISLGGMITWLAAAADPRITAAAALIGVHGFKWALENNQYQARVASIQKVFDVAASDLGKDEVDADVVIQVWNKLLPGIIDKYDAVHSLPCIAPRPLLVLNGEDDPRCPVDSLMLAVEATRRHYLNHPRVFEVYVQKGTGHTKTDEMVAATYKFFEKTLLK
mmetsp:Transcript_23017/g.40868  ORF Transcript_23017/g.40868 Transcript_23017/m.40868 type:complete len:392 (-) Transcript_23017:420-1595(-)